MPVVGGASFALDGDEEGFFVTRRISDASPTAVDLPMDGFGFSPVQEPSKAQVAPLGDARSWMVILHDLPTCSLDGHCAVLPRPIIGALQSHNEVSAIYPKLGRGINVEIGALRGCIKMVVSVER